MDFIAHTENSKGDCHKLADHLSAVGRLAFSRATQLAIDAFVARHGAMIALEKEEWLRARVLPLQNSSCALGEGANPIPGRGIICAESL